MIFDADIALVLGLIIATLCTGGGYYYGYKDAIKRDNDRRQTNTRY